MASKYVDTDSLVFPKGAPALSHESGAELRDGAFIIIAQAFCPNGHDLVSVPGPLFDGFPGISVRIRGVGFDDVVTLSSMHGDDRKEGAEGLADGTRYTLSCPVCDVELPSIGRCDCGTGELHSFDLVPKGNGEIAAVCDVAGCRRSRVADGLEVLAVFQED